VQPDALDRECEEGTAQDQKQDRRIIFLGDGIGVHHPEGRDGQEGKECGDGQRHRFGHPPDCHQDGQRRNAPRRRFHARGGRQRQHRDESQQAADQPEQARARHPSPNPITESCRP
jgi:hypothetical protein